MECAVRGIDEVAAIGPVERLQGPVRAGRDPDIDLGLFWRGLWARRLWILVPTLAACLASGLAVKLATPVYKSEARILIDSRANTFLRPEIGRPGEAERARVDPPAIASQVQLLLSRDIAREVVARLQGAGGELRRVGDAAAAGQDTAATEADRVTAYFAALRVYPVSQSRVIVVEFASPDPDLAARTVNTIVETYLRLQQDAKRRAARQASAWLAGEIARLRGAVADSEARVEAFRADADLHLGIDDTPLSNQQISELTTQLGLARAQVADADGKAREIRAQIASGHPLEASEILNTDLIRNLIERRAQLKGALAEHSSTLLGEHPRIKALRAMIAALDSQIRAEADALANALEGDARIARARAEQLEQDLDRLKRAAADANNRTPQLQALSREAAAERELLASYLARYWDSAARDTSAAQPVDARVINWAETGGPSAPRKLPTIALVTLATLVLSTGLVAANEMISGRAYGRSGGGSRAAPAPTSGSPRRPRPADAVIVGRRGWMRSSPSRARRHSEDPAGGWAPGPFSQGGSSHSFRCDQHAVGNRLDGEAARQPGAEGRAERRAAVDADDEFVEAGLKALAPEPVITAEPQVLRLAMPQWTHGRMT